MAGVMYDLVILFWRVVINIFFREIRPRGTFNIPREGPVIFVGAPHHNQFLDPLLLSSEVRRECPRRVAFLAAAASIKRLFVGAFIRMLDSIPVTRAADLAKMGVGKLYIEESDPLRIIGVGTQFKKQCVVRGQLVLPKHVGYAQGEIAEIISDTEIRLSREFISAGKGGASDVRATQKVISEAAAAKAQGEPGLAFKALPYVDQHEVYGHVYKRLEENGAIGIFPEGGSHDRPDLLPLKAGVSVMALGAMSQNKNLKIKIVPVGLSYFHPHKFRSRAVVEFGTPIEVPRELVALFDKGGEQKREGCGKLLEMIHDGLKAVTIRTPDPETLMVIHAGRRLYKSPGQQWTLGQVVELTKRFIEAYQVYRDEPRVIRLTDKVRRYNRKLRDLGLKDHQVERATTQRKLRNLLLLIYRSNLLLAWAILALPGVITHAPIFIPAKMYSKVKAKEALAASSVKIAARDVIATWKILFSLAATPALYIVYAILATWLAWRNGASSAVVKSMPALIFIIMPFFAMSSLKFGEAGMDVFKSLRPLFLSLLPGSQKELEKLRKTRESLANELSEVINDFGPKLWVNFHQSRLRPAASVPQTGENPGMMYRKGDSADSSVLSHPMLWLDERIFGWSRSAAKGPNVWNAKPRSELGSPPLSPTESDTEEVGGADVDYDDVLAIIDTRRSRNDVRAGGTSYSSRNQPSMEYSPNYLENANDDTVRRRKPRTRAESLNHAVTAEELKETNAREGDATFASVASELNKDADTSKGDKAE